MNRWLIGILAVLALLFALAMCNRTAAIGSGNGGSGAGSVSSTGAS